MFLRTSDILNNEVLAAGAHMAPLFSHGSFCDQSSRQSPDFANLERPSLAIVSLTRAILRGYIHNYLPLPSCILNYSISDGSHFKIKRPRHHPLPGMEAKWRLRMVSIRHQTRAPPPSRRHKIHHRSRQPANSTHRKDSLHLHRLQNRAFFTAAHNRRLVPHRPTFCHRRPHARPERELE